MSLENDKKYKKNIFYLDTHYFYLNIGIYKQEQIMAKQYESFQPGKDWFKTIVNQIVLFVLGRGFQAASKVDKDVQKEIAAWPEGFTVMMRVLPEGPSMVVRKQNDRIKYIGTKHNDPDLVVNFKNDDSAFMVFTAQVGTAKGYAEHRMSVKGDLTNAMILIRCLNMIEGYLFPKIINKMILKRVPPMPPLKQLYRLYIYLIGIPLGL